MRRLLLAITFCLAFIGSQAQYVSLNETELYKLKLTCERDSAARMVFKRFEATAENALSEKPNPIEVIASEGLLMGNPTKIATLKAVEDAFKIYSLALLYRFSNHKKYLDKAIEYLVSWAKVNKPNGNPVNETKMEDAIVGYDLIREVLPAHKRHLIDDWLIKMINAEINFMASRVGKNSSINNWNSNRVKIITQIAFTLKNKKYETIAEEELKKQILNNLNSDGSTFDFLERDALHYHIFSLDPFLKSITVFHRATGKNYFNMESEKIGSIEKSVEFLIPFVTGEKTHEEFKNSKVSFDRQRAKNNEKGYQVANFIPSKGIVVLAAASYFKPQYRDVIEQSFLNITESNEWEILLNKIRTTKP
jgi:hypothetical protein